MTKIHKAIKSDNPVKIIVHFNKFQAPKGLPWTVHIRGVCIPAKEVHWEGATPKTIWKPTKPSNPRGWIECRGSVAIDDNNIVRIKGV